MEQTAIVVVPRERLSPTRAAFQRLSKSGAAAVWVVDARRDADAELAADVARVDSARVLRAPAYATPAECRGLVVEQLSSLPAPVDVVIFVDNDVDAAPAALSRMAATLRGSGAATAHPLVLIDLGSQTKVHAAACRVDDTEAGRLPVIELCGAPLQGTERLERRQDDYGELHCLAIRRDVLAGVRFPNVVVAEDVALGLALAGRGSVFEPAARVRYQPELAMSDEDQRYFSLRWDPQRVESSILALAQYGLHPRYWEEKRRWLAEHRRFQSRRGWWRALPRRLWARSRR